MINTLISTALALAISTYPSVELDPRKSDVVMPPQQSSQVAYMDQNNSVKNKDQVPLKDRALEEQETMDKHQEKKDKKKLKEEEKEMKKAHKAGCKRCGVGKVTAVV